MPKALCIFGAVVSVLLLLVFGFDMLLGFPFSQASQKMDLGLIVCGGVLAYLSWSTFREQA